MSTFSIKDLEQLSGIKAHTIRIWEQRYKIISPQRTKTNIRFYDDNDLKRVLNISLLNSHGFKISKIARMQEHELQSEVVKITENATLYSDQIQALTIAMIELNENQFQDLITKNTTRIGFEETVLKIIYPFLVRIGVLWQTGSIVPAQEHFISNLIRQKVIAAIDAQQAIPDGRDQKFMLFLPEGELHEISLLFTHYLLKSRNKKSIYLGQSVPFSDLVSVYQRHQPDYLITILTSKPGQFDPQYYINQLAEKFPNCTILVSGMQLLGKGIEAPINVKILDSVQELIALAENP